MSKIFKTINVEDIQENTFKLIGKDWFLIAAGNAEKYNPMTASWGGFGIMWHKPVAYTVIRNTRFTYDLVESSEFFTMSFFDEQYRKALAFCGKNSGREMDKIKETGLTPITCDRGVYFEEAKLSMTCKRLFSQDYNPDSFLDSSIDDTFYPNKDYHRLYISEIVHCQVAE